MAHVIKHANFELYKQISGNVDILLVSETKIDDRFTQGQFAIDGFSVAFKLHCNFLGGRQMLFVREDRYSI